jgi:CRISPR/Cas system CMR-associated protein Cmr5 small subunit
MLNIDTIEDMIYDILIKNNISNNNLLSNIKSWLLEDTQIKLLKGKKGDNITIKDIIKKCNLKNIKGKKGITYDYNLLLDNIKNWLILQKDIIKGYRGEYYFMEQPPIDYDVYNNDIINYLNNNNFRGLTGPKSFGMQDITIHNNILTINYTDNIMYTSDILKGSKGDNIYLGITGYNGSTGSNGNTGFQGIIGTTGPQGIMGNTGIKGITGTRGPSYIINIQDYLNPLYYIYLGDIDNNIYNCSDLSEILNNSIFINNNYQSYIIKYKLKNIHYINNIDYSNQNDNRLYKDGIFKPIVNGDWNIMNKIIIELNYNRLNKSCCLVLVTYCYYNNIWKQISYSIETIIYSNFLINPIITLMNNNILYLNENNNLMSILFLYGDIPNKIEFIGNAEFRLINKY